MDDRVLNLTKDSLEMLGVRSTSSRGERDFLFLFKK
jgi:hypothetical protein